MRVFLCFSLLLGVLVLAALVSTGRSSLAGHAKADSSSQQLQPNGAVAVRTDELRTPNLTLRDGHEVVANYIGPQELVKAFEAKTLDPLSLATGDFDEDGVPDLVAGFAGPTGGALSLYRGNIDSIYPNNPDAQRRRRDGASTDAPFLSQSHVFPATQRPEFLGVGDFDNDGHLDIVSAARGSSELDFVPGDGHGGFGPERKIELPGRVTTMVTGEINRADGLIDIVVGVVTPDGPQALVFEGPEGALKANPESIPLPAEATAMALGRLDDHYEMDLAVAAGPNLVVIRGRDRKPSLDETERQKVGPPMVSYETFQSEIKSLAIGSFTGDQETSLAMLFAEGSVQVLSKGATAARRASAASSIRSWSAVATLANACPNGSQLMRARLSSRSGDDLVVVEPDSHELRILEGIKNADQVDSTSWPSSSAIAPLAVDGEPIAVLPMLLNSDAISDLVVLRKGSVAPATVLSTPAATFTVTNTNDGGAGSLKQAITDANNSAGADSITFSIGAGPQTLSAGSGLPSITEAVTIDATTQPGFAGVPIIQLPGGNGTPFEIHASNTTVRGFVINGWTSANARGVVIVTGSGNLIEGNYIGTDTSGSTAMANGIGVEIQSSNNQIGRPITGGRNIISGNQADGIMIIHDASGNHVSNNYIGTDVSGNSAITNGRGGIEIDTANDNIIGGTIAAAANVISGNVGVGPQPHNGVKISNSGGTGASGNLVQGNFIGTNVNGSSAIGNGENGVRVDDSGPNTIGGTAAGAGNVISGNVAAHPDGYGVKISGNSATSNQVQGNLIGTNASGTAKIPNGDPGNTGGVFVEGSNNTIGGTAAGARNVISGNNNQGIDIGGTSNVVQGNFIGTDITGNVALGNFRNGIAGGGSNHLIGGTSAAARNVLSSNGATGILLLSAGSGIQIQGNYIGVGADGTSALGNNSYGVLIDSLSNNTIGGTAAGAGNVISANSGGGVVLRTGGTGNAVQGNSIFSNSGLGIDLNDDGLTANDNCDADTGSNNLQNFPVITLVFTNGGSTNIQGTLNSISGGTFTVEFFTNTEVDPSGNGEGQTFVGSTTVTLDAGCTKNFNFTPASPLTSGLFVSSTATDAAGNTSEFGPNRQVESPTAADGTIGGTITDASGTPVSGVTINLSSTQAREAITDASGKYSFDSVETNGFYTVTPSRVNYTFSPQNRSFSLLGVHTDASFTASANGAHANAIDTTEFFVRQQYLDFLGREPDPPGFIGWVNTINNCAAGDTSCDRVHVSEMFYRSQEFRERGYFVYRFYSTAFGRKPDYAEFTPDLARVSGFLTNDQLEAAKVALIDDFMSRPAFASQYNSLGDAAFVDKLTQTAGVDLSNRQALIDSLNRKTLTRAQVLRQIAESVEVYQKYYDQAFVVMEYFGYLRRDPDALYANWISVLDANPADSRHMVEGFVNSAEYRNRFAQ